MDRETFYPMKINFEPLTHYLLPNSPFKSHLDKAIKSLYHEMKQQADFDDARAMENALYYAVKKRMQQTDFMPDQELDYLEALLSDIRQAEIEFGQVCYANANAEEVFDELNQAIVDLLNRAVDENQENTSLHPLVNFKFLAVPLIFLAFGFLIYALSMV